MRTLAKNHGASVAQIALSWLLAKNVVTSVILGASKLSQLEDNLGALAVKLSEAEIAELDNLTQLPPAYPNWFTDRIAGDQPALNALRAK